MRRGLRHLFQQVLEVAQGSVLERVPDAKGIECTVVTRLELPDVDEI